MLFRQSIGHFSPAGHKKINLLQGFIQHVCHVLSFGGGKYLYSLMFSVLIFLSVSFLSCFLSALSPWISTFSHPGVRDYSQLTLDLTRNELIVGAR